MKSLTHMITNPDTLILFAGHSCTRPDQHTGPPYGYRAARNIMGREVQPFQSGRKRRRAGENQPNFPGRKQRQGQPSLPGRKPITAEAVSAQLSWEETVTGRGESAQPPEEEARTDGAGPVPTSRGVTGTENGLANRKSPENSQIVRNTNPRENTPDSSPPVQADPLTCESIGSCDIIDMPNSDDHKKEVRVQM